MLIESNNLQYTWTDFAQERVYQVASVIKRVMEIARGILFSPFIFATAWSEGSKVFFHKISYEKTGGNTELCKQKVVAKNPVILDSPDEYYSWKIALLESAKHSIEISNYCGGKPFLKTLDIISKKIEENPHFRARILTNSYTVNPEEKKIVDEMMAKYPENFEAIIIPVGCFSYTPKVKRHENHTKMVIADQKYCLTGGSTLTNLILPHGTVKAAGGKMSHIANGIHDLDMAAEGQIAETMKLQFDQLWLKWKKLQNIPENASLDKGYEFSALHERALLPQFAEKKVCDEIPCKLLLSQPEQGKENLSLKKYLKFIEKAQHTITVSHVSFNEKRVVQALERAIRRGVKVEIITSGYGSKASFASNILSIKNRTNYKSLMDAAKESKGSCHIFEYKQEDILFHSKTMVFDGEVMLLGSVNITRESMKCDDETLLSIESKAMVNRVLKSCQMFKGLSDEVTESSMGSCSFVWSLIKGNLLDIVSKNLCD